MTAAVAVDKKICNLSMAGTLLSLLPMMTAAESPTLYQILVVILEVTPEQMMSEAVRPKLMEEIQSQEAIRLTPGVVMDQPERKKLRHRIQMILICRPK